MPSRGHRSDYVILGVLAVAAAAVILVLIGLDWLDSDAGTGAPVRTTYGTSAGGLMGWYLLLERLDVPVRRWRRPPAELRPADAGVLAVIDPVVRIGHVEAAAVDDWVRAGGVLVCTGDWAGALGRIHGIDVAPAVAPDPKEEHPPTGIPPGETGRALARDVGSVVFATRQSIEVPRGPGGPGGIETLFADAAGVRIASRRVGAGWAVVLADSSFLANALLGKADNAVLAANLAAYAAWRSRGGPLAFDEYHFGYGGRQTGWDLLAKMMVTTSGGWAVLVVTAAGLMLLVLKGRQFGPRRPDQHRRRRSKREYVFSIGATFRAARAEALTFRLLYQNFRRRCARRAGLPAHASPAAMAACLVRGAPRAGQRLRRFLEDAGTVGVDARMSRGRFAAMVREMTELESEVLHADRRGQ